jgi:hypothetical protein
MAPARAFGEALNGRGLRSLTRGGATFRMGTALALIGLGCTTGTRTTRSRLGALFCSRTAFIILSVYYLKFMVL